MLTQRNNNTDLECPLFISLLIVPLSLSPPTWISAMAWQLLCSHLASCCVIHKSTARVVLSKPKSQASHLGSSCLSDPISDCSVLHLLHSHWSELFSVPWIYHTHSHWRTFPLVTPPTWNVLCPNCPLVISLSLSPQPKSPWSPALMLQSKEAHLSLHHFHSLHLFFHSRTLSSFLSPSCSPPLPSSHLLTTTRPTEQHTLSYSCVILNTAKCFAYM